MKLAALIIDTFREIYAKKVILAIIVVEIIALAFTGFYLFSNGMQSIFRGAAELSAVGNRPAEHAKTPNDSMTSIDSLLLGDDESGDSTADTASHAREGSITFSTTIPGDSTHGRLRSGQVVMLEDMVRGPETFYALAICAATLFLGIFATAGIIPSMMEKGAIDLLLSKPLSRTKLILGRALGGIIAIFVNLILFTTAIWALYGFASGVWYMPFLYWTIAISGFSYLVVYSGVMLMNVISESWVLPLSLAYAHIMILSSILASRETMLYSMIQNGLLRRVIDGIYYLLPQTADLGQKILLEGVSRGSISVMEPLVQGAIFAVVMTAAAVWRFNRKDF